MKQPVITIVMSCRRELVAAAVTSELSDSGPIIMAIARALNPPTACTTPEPGEIAVTMAEAIVGAELRQPPAAPSPIAIQWICDRGEQHARNRESGELPSLRRGAGDDRCGGVHEHHLEEEHHHYADVVGRAAEKETPLVPSKPQALAAQEIDGEL